jgi:hypothetical protein
MSTARAKGSRRTSMPLAQIVQPNATVLTHRVQQSDCESRRRFGATSDRAQRSENVPAMTTGMCTGRGSAGPLRIPCPAAHVQSVATQQCRQTVRGREGGGFVEHRAAPYQRLTAWHRHVYVFSPVSMLLTRTSPSAEHVATWTSPRYGRNVTPKMLPT